MTYLLSLGSDLNHINGYDSTLIGTILHGAKNCPNRASRDYAGCLALALEAGAPLFSGDINMTDDDELRALMTEWSGSQSEHR